MNELVIKVQKGTINEKICLYDWVSFTSKIHDVEQIKTILGMEDLKWEKTKGARGYQDRLYYGSISIHYNGTSDMGVWCEMSGQGCRTFEELGRNDYEYIFNLIIKNSAQNRMHLTRLDVAYDDKGEPKVLDLDVLFKDTYAENFITKWQYYEYIGGTGGYTIYHGSPKSDVRLRIYDKAKERGYFDGMHWVRSELQLRDDRAFAFIKAFGGIGEKYLGVMKNYLRYVTPSKTDTNKQRWEMSSYWSNFLGNVESIALYTKPGLEYNLFNLNRYLLKYAGGSIRTAIQIYGIDYFKKKIEDSVEIKNPRHKKILSEKAVPCNEEFEKFGKFLSSSDVSKYREFIKNPNKFAESKLAEEKKNFEDYQRHWYEEMMSGRTPKTFEAFVKENKVERELQHKVESSPRVVLPDDFDILNAFKDKKVGKKNGN